MNIQKKIIYQYLSFTLAAIPTYGWAKCDVKSSDNTPTSRYVVKNGEAYDTQTKLTWQRCSVGQHWTNKNGCEGTPKSIPFKEAQLLNTKLGRAPTIDELKTLISSTCNKPAINTEIFSDIKPDTKFNQTFYWSSSTNGTTDAWHVIFFDGSVHNSYRQHDYAVRLVRNGE